MRSPLLPVPRIPITGRVSFLSADVRAGLGVAVPTHAFLVVDAAIRIQPNDYVSGAVHLRGTLAAEELQRPGRNRCAGRRLML
jgi:hypothetical protein